jgi:hypothetical protein
MVVAYSGPQHSEEEEESGVMSRRTVGMVVLAHRPTIVLHFKKSCRKRNLSVFESASSEINE